jgi:hypothetical protein
MLMKKNKKARRSECNSVPILSDVIFNLLPEYIEKLLFGFDTITGRLCYFIAIHLFNSCRYKYDLFCFTPSLSR